LPKKTTGPSLSPYSFLHLTSLSLKGVTDGKQLGQLASKILSCANAVIHRAIELGNECKDEGDQHRFLRQFRAGLQISQKPAAVDKIMTIVNQCVKEKLKYMSNDPQINRLRNNVAPKQKQVSARALSQGECVCVYVAHTSTNILPIITRTH
jgi:hypothetical protein